MTTTLSRRFASLELNNRRACPDPETPVRGAQSPRNADPLSMSSFTARCDGPGIGFPGLGNSGRSGGLKRRQSTRSATP